MWVAKIYTEDGESYILETERGERIGFETLEDFYNFMSSTMPNDIKCEPIYLDIDFGERGQNVNSVPVSKIDIKLSNINILFTHIRRLLDDRE